MSRNTLKDIANDKRKSLIKKIKQNKKLQKIQEYKNKVLLGLGVLGATTLIGTENTQNKKDYNLSDIKIETTVNKISIDKEIVSAKDFYKKVKYNILTNDLFYQKSNGEKVNISDMVDNNYLNKLNKKRLKDNGLTFRFNDIPVSFKNDTIIKLDTLMYIPKGALICEVKVDTINNPLLSYLESSIKLLKNDTIKIYPEKDILSTKADTIISERIFGKNKGSALTDQSITKGSYYSTAHGAYITMNRFVSDTTLTKEEQEKANKRFKKHFDIDVDSLDYYDPKIEGGDPYKTYDHEEGHWQSEMAGIKSYGLHIEHTYKLAIHDEIKSNIKQLIKQRTEYLRTGNINSIPKYAFYRNAIKKGIINPINEEISDEEKAFIGKEIYNYWYKNSKDGPTYSKQLKNITKDIMDNSIVNDDIEESSILYQNVLKRVYKIETSDGEIYDFFPFIAEPELNDNDKKIIENIRKERGTNLGDEFARIKKEYGEDALIDFIWQEKVKLMEEDKKEREKHQQPLKPNSEAYIRRQREIEKEIIISKKKKFRY